MIVSKHEYTQTNQPAKNPDQIFQSADNPITHIHKLFCTAAERIDNKTKTKTLWLCQADCQITASSTHVPPLHFFQSKTTTFTPRALKSKET